MFVYPNYSLQIKQTLTIKPKDFYMRAILRNGGYFVCSFGCGRFDALGFDAINAANTQAIMTRLRHSTVSQSSLILRWRLWVV